MNCIKIIFFLISFFFSLDTLGQQDLVGKWLRVEDRLQNPNSKTSDTQDSIIIDIRKVERNFIGTLIRVTETSSEYGYSVGQLKWRNFRSIDENTYELEGLLMDLGPDGHFDSPAYIKSFIRLTSNKNIILIRTEEESERFTGQKQKWIRLRNM